MWIHHFGVIAFCCFASAFALDVQDVVFVILSQPNDYHLKLAQQLKNDLQMQSDREGYPIVHLSHQDFPHVGDWTIIPLIPTLVSMHRINSSFIIFIEDYTHVKLLELIDLLQPYEDEERFIGYALHDKEPTIIHHFAFYDNPKHFKYPNLASGIVLSTPLMIRLMEEMMSKNVPKTDFNIDTAHELALFIWNDGAGVELTHESRFCWRSHSNCVTYPLPFQPCDENARKDEIYIAVKTFSKFHKKRLTVVKHTWGKHAPIIKYFSDVTDDKIPTIGVGVPNTKHGHCKKTFAIFRYILDVDLRDMPEIKWIILVDDDTILSTSRLRSLLSCYLPPPSSSSSSSARNFSELILGERYGYGVRTAKGYNYITGGGGTVISRALLKRLAYKCECPSANSPDDMYIGLCLQELGVRIVHSPFFHQARPDDYAPELLHAQYPVVSFHKHWMVDPYKVYKTWFASDDEEDDDFSALENNNSLENNVRHTEL